jgi:hypothetical protein
MATKKEEKAHLQLVMDYCKYRLREVSGLQEIHRKLKSRGTLSAAENQKIRSAAEDILGTAAAKIPTLQDSLDHADLNAYLESLNS